MRRQVLFTLLFFCLVGCGPIKLPSLPKPIKKPGAAVVGVRLVEAGEAASRYAIDVSFYNPNDFPLPLTFAKYRLAIGGKNYETDSIPRATLPASGRITLAFPAVLIATEAPAGAYQTSGRVTLTPAGEVRRLLYQIGLPKPKTSFASEGEVARTP